MMKRMLKRTLATLIVLVMVFTTFMIFDPSALFPHAHAASYSVAVNDTSQYSATSTANGYAEIKDWTISGPFYSAEVYTVEFDAIGTSGAKLAVYLYNNSGSTPNARSWLDGSDGTTVTNTSSDGATEVYTSTAWVHYRITWTFGNGGSSSLNKSLLFRTLKGGQTIYVRIPQPYHRTLHRIPSSRRMQLVRQYPLYVDHIQVPPERIRKAHNPEAYARGHRSQRKQLVFRALPQLL